MKLFRSKIINVLIPTLMTFILLCSCSTSVENPSGLNSVQVENTVQVEVNRRLTELAPTPDLNATVDARLTDIARSATPTSTPNRPSPEPEANNKVANTTSQDINLWRSIANFASLIFSLAGRIWSMVSQYGIVAQSLCCVIPLIGGSVTIFKQ